MSAVSWLSAKAAHKQAVVARLKLRLGAGVEHSAGIVIGHDHPAGRVVKFQHRIAANGTGTRLEPHHHVLAEGKERHDLPVPRHLLRLARQGLGRRRDIGGRPIARDPVAARPQPAAGGGLRHGGGAGKRQRHRPPSWSRSVWSSRVLRMSARRATIAPDAGDPPEKAWRGCRLHALWKEPSRPAILRPRWTGSHTSSPPGQPPPPSGPPAFGSGSGGCWRWPLRSRPSPSRGWEAHYLNRAGQADTATLRLATEVLRGVLERTEALPALIAERPILAQLLRDPENSGLVPFTNELLRQSALSLDVSDIYVMDLQGRTVATSNYRSDWSFLGRSFEFRPYFTDAISDGLGRFHALGTTSNQRGYFFAAPVIDRTELLGVVAVKISLDRFEETWANAESTIVVTDTSNVVFLSDRADWHFRTLGPVPEAAIETIARTRQYPPGTLAPLNARRAPLNDEMDLLTVTGADDVPEEFVSQTMLIAAPAWRVSILTPTAPAIAQAWTALGIAVLLVAVGRASGGRGAAAARAADGTDRAAAQRPGRAGGARSGPHARSRRRQRAAARRGRGTPGHRGAPAPHPGRTGAGGQARGTRPDVGGAQSRVQPAAGGG